MGIDCRLDLGWGSEAAGSDERAGALRMGRAACGAL